MQLWRIGPLSFSLSALGAQTAARQYLRALMCLAAVVSVVLLATAILAYARRRMRRNLKDHATGFTLEDLRSLRESGRLTSAEYEALARQMC